MKIALCQMSMSESAIENYEKSLRMFREAVTLGADLIVYPEIQLSRFFPQYKKQNVSDYLMNIDSPFIKELRELCRQYSVMAAPNIYLSENGKIYDATILIEDDGSIKGVQKMVHIAQAEQFYEQDYYSPSDDGFKVFDTNYGKIGIVVCFDRHYPESIRTESLMGADLILIPTANTKSEPLEIFEWEVRVQAFQNSTAIAMCNRVGKEGNMDFAGESLICDAKGNLLAKADDKEQIILADINLKDTQKIRETRPYTNLRRKELYL